MHFYGWIYTAGLDAQFWIFAYIRFLKHCVRVCVLAAVRHNRLTSDVTDQEIETRITKWLQNAPDRNGGRSERMRRKERWKAMPNCSLMLLLFEQMLLLFEEKTVFQCLFAFLNSMQCFSVFFPPTNFSVWTVKDWQCSNAKCVFYSCTIYVPVSVYS